MVPDAEPHRVPRPATLAAPAEPFRHRGSCVNTVVMSVYRSPTFPMAAVILGLHAVRPGIASPRLEVTGWSSSARHQIPSGGDSPSRFLRADARLRAGRRRSSIPQERGAAGGPETFRFVDCEWPKWGRAATRSSIVNFHYAIDPRHSPAPGARPSSTIDPGLLQFWMSTGPRGGRPTTAMTTGETVHRPAARFSDCGLRWQRIRRPCASSCGPFTSTRWRRPLPPSSTWSTTDLAESQRERQDRPAQTLMPLSER